MTVMSNFSLRLQASTMEEVKKVVIEEGTTINQFINIAVAEKLAALRTEEYFRKRAARANMSVFWSILEKAGSEEPRKGDEFPQKIASQQSQPKKQKLTTGGNKKNLSKST